MQILTDNVQMMNYRYFTINDPKTRTICAAPFPMRVLFHAVMRICHPVFDQFQIDDSFASRIGKGQYMAIDRARKFARQFKWFAKLDVIKYFDSIDHQILLKQLKRLFKDKQLLNFFNMLIDGYNTISGKGLPIGNLTSQYFANHYLAVSDHFSKNHLRIPAYLRYMDDMLIFAADKDMLKKYVTKITDFIKQNLKLKMHLPVINQTAYGVPFLGYVITPNDMRLTKRSRKRYKHKIGILNRLLSEGVITEEKCAMRAQCLTAFIDKADTLRFKQKLMNIKGLHPFGL